MIGRDTHIVAFDTETTGLSAADGRIVEIAAIAFNMQGEELGRFSELVNPRITIPEEVIQIHGITNGMVADKPGITEILGRFKAFIAGEDTILVAQNAVFDIGFVNEEARRHDVAMPRNCILDQIDLTRLAFPELPSLGLESVVKALNLVDAQTHRAMADAVLVKRLFLRCLEHWPDEEKKHKILNGLYHYTFGGTIIARVDEGLMNIVKEALGKGKILEIVYAGGTAKDRPRRIIPLIMYNRDGIMFLTARCLSSNRNKQFRMDRIKTCEMVP